MGNPVESLPLGPVGPLADDLTTGHGNARSSSSYPAMCRSSYDALVLDAGQRQALVTVRSLGRRGLRIAGMETGGGIPAFASRWCRQGFDAPNYAHGAQSYLACLENVLDRSPVDVLIPTADGTIALLRANRERLERWTRIALAPEAALQIAINKEQTLETARHLGLPVPRSVIVQGVSEVLAAIREVGLPAVVKPAESWMEGDRGGVRVAPQLVATLDEARRVVAASEPFHTSMVFQTYLSGRREAVMFVYAGDVMYARFAQWAQRMFPPLGGSSVLRQSIAVPEDSGAYAERLVREIGLEGYCEVEFRRDDRGTAYLMEINPRLSASVEVAVRAGVDFPYLLYQWARGGPIERVQGYREGIWQRHVGNDIRLLTAAFLERGRPEVPSRSAALRDFFTSFFVPAGYDYVDRTDPAPGLVATVGFVQLALGYLRPTTLRRLRQQAPSYRVG